MKRLILSLGIAVCAGCAMRPESVKPAYISDMTYRDWTCEQLGQEQTRLAAALASSCDAQRQARSGDTWGVILLGLPVSTLSGNNQASEIARLKGELQALQRAATLKNCNLPEIPDPVAKRKARQRETAGTP